MIFFRDEIVEPRLGLEQRGVKRGLGAVVRMQMELRVHQRCVLRAEPREQRESQAAKKEATPWKLRRTAHGFADGSAFNLGSHKRPDPGLGSFGNFALYTLGLLVVRCEE